MRTWSILLAIFAAPYLAAFSSAFVRETRAADSKKPPLLLISLDGFRWDYLDKVKTPNLHRLMETGVHAKSLISVFPSKTFPNHYSMVTGLYPEKHGIIGNHFWAPELKAEFNMHERDRKLDPKFWKAEPLWTTAEHQGVLSASMYWVGADADIPDRHPRYWKSYDDDKKGRKERVDQAMAWLELPSPKRPGFLMMYFEDTDNKGHSYGPESDEVKKAIADVDETIGDLEKRLESRGLLDQVNIIIVSDHGMTTMSKDRVVYIDDIVSLDDVEPFKEDIVLNVWPKPGKEPMVVKALEAAHPQHMDCYRKDQIPTRWHFRDSVRIAPMLCVAQEGWLISKHSFVDSPKYHLVVGNHGFDNELPSMQGLFIAHGPAFKKGVEVPSFLNLNIYPMMAHILGVKPLPNDGDLSVVKGMLSQ